MMLGRFTITQSFEFGALAFKIPMSRFKQPIVTRRSTELELPVTVILGHVTYADCNGIVDRSDTNRSSNNHASSVETSLQEQSQ